MENLKRSFSDKFLEKVLQLGEIFPVNDEKFRVVFRPENNKAAFIYYKGKDSIAVTALKVNNYQPLNFQTDELIEDSCNEGEAIWILKNLSEF